MKKNKILSHAFVIVLVAIVIISIIGILTMSGTHVVLQGQIEATEIRISGKLPGRVDTFLVNEGQRVMRGDTLVGISSPEAYAKLQQANALEDVAKYQNETKVHDSKSSVRQRNYGTRARPTCNWQRPLTNASRPCTKTVW